MFKGVMIVVLFIALYSSFVFGYEVSQKLIEIEKEQHVFVYFYNDKTEMWDRARKEDLMNAACEKFMLFKYAGESK